jgi:hypothetical protein
MVCCDAPLPADDPWLARQLRKAKLLWLLAIILLLGEVALLFWVAMK